MLKRGFKAGGVRGRRQPINRTYSFPAFPFERGYYRNYKYTTKEKTI